MSSTLPSAGHDLASIAVLIPAWCPEDNVLAFTRSLVDAGFTHILFVDDGSGPACTSVFTALALLPEVHILHHAVNLGKGRALKTGINHVLATAPSIEAILTADADGQHLPADIVRVAQAARPANATVLGVRHFAADVPLRSRFGNLLTRRIFALVTGCSLADTQTGLRLFPRSVLPQLLTLSGERYEYEMTVLAHLCRTGPRPLEVPIQTVYIDGNRSSHFDPIRDSMRIYFVLARFYLSSIVAAGIDFAGFSITFAATHNVLLSVIVGRFSSLVNFALNRKFVFHNEGSVGGALWRYYALAVAIGGASYGLIWGLTQAVHWNVFAAKLVVDVLLSFVSFSVQRSFVFRRRQDF